MTETQTAAKRTSKMSFTVNRPWERGTLARITATVDADKFEEMLLKAPSGARALKWMVREAVTKWVEETDEGKAAYDRAKQALDIGDLADLLGDNGVKERLAEAGVLSLDIETESEEHNVDWQFDDHLVEVPR